MRILVGNGREHRSCRWRASKGVKEMQKKKNMQKKKVMEETEKGSVSEDIR